MRIKQRRQYEMLLRVRDFGQTHGHVFRATGMAPELFRSINTAVDELAATAVAKASAAVSSRADEKRRARQHLAALLVKVSQLARVLRARGQTVPCFMLPASRCDHELLTVARHFARTAAAFDADFSGHGMGPTTIAAAANAFARAMSERRAGRAGHTAALVRIKELLASALLDVRRLDLIISTELADDAVVTAVWKQARHVGAVRPPLRAVDQGGIVSASLVGPSWDDTAQRPSDHAPREDERRHAQHRSTEHERDYDDVPKRTVVIEPREVQRVQPVVEPAVYPGGRVVAVDDASRPGIDVITGVHGVVHPYQDDGQRPVAPAIEVITVVLRQHAGFHGPWAGGGPNNADDPLMIEGLERLAPQRNHARITGGEGGQIGGLAGERGELELLDRHGTKLGQRRPWVLR